MAPAIADRRPKYVTKSCYVPMSESGQTLPMDSAPVPPDVRCCAKSDHSRRECEMTRRAMYGRRPVQEESGFLRSVRVQPCIRPVFA